MKSITKRVGALAVVLAILFTLIVGSCFAVFPGLAYAETVEDHAYKYYRNQVAKDSRAEKFYTAFETLLTSGEFLKGKIEYDLIANNVSSTEDVTAYVNGANDKLAVAYSAARDAFYMDHPDLFYVDLFSTSISAGQQGEKYVAYLDSSRSLTTYRGNIDTPVKVFEAIDKYEAKLAGIVGEANKKATVKEKIEYVNGYLAGNVNYGYGTKVENGRNVDTEKAAFIYTAYGALVLGESVCEGYAKSFKAVMDRLGIPCVCVQGYADGSGKGDYEPHMWNYVQVEGQWYAVDPTYNATSGKTTKWLLVGGQFITDTHIEDGSVSTSGYTLKYPVLKPYEYGNDLDSNGMTVLGSYTYSEEYGSNLELLVSYDGKGALKLQEENKYLAYRFGTGDGKGNINWRGWVNIVAMNNAMQQAGYGEPYPVTDYDTRMTSVASTAEYVQFTLFRRAPDEKGDMLTGDAIISYNSDTLVSDDYLIEPTTPYRNNGYSAGNNPSPGAVSFSPANTGDLPVDRTYDMKVAYHTKLKLVDPSQEVGMTFTVSAGSDSIEGNAFLSDVKWDGDKTLTFKFTPSKMYIHNMAVYTFTPTNLVGENSDKYPDPFTYTFKGKSVVCSKVFNDGRLYMSVFGQPKMLDDSDLSVTDFKDDQGNYFAASQRSQLMLVATKPTAEKEQQMDATLKSETGIKDDEILASSTYEIDLQICGVVRTVPNGSYMQVAFGFPEGYSPDDAGTTFKIYHYKHDDKGNITGVEEIPVIVTQYGLIAKVHSFSPFTIVQVKNTSAAVVNGKTSTNVYACVNGNVGGTVTSNGKSGISEVSGKSITYNIKADDGYTIGSVRLNGKVIDSSYYKNGKLTLAKKDLDQSNMLEVTFVTKDSAESYASKGITLINGVKSDYKPSNSNAAGIAIGCTVGVLVLAGAGFAAWWFLIKNKKPAKAAASAKTVKSSAANSKKSSVSRQNTPSNVKKSTNDAAAKQSGTTKPSAASKSKTASSAAKTSVNKTSSGNAKTSGGSSTKTSSKNGAAKKK